MVEVLIVQRCRGKPCAEISEEVLTAVKWCILIWVILMLSPDVQSCYAGSQRFTAEDCMNTITPRTSNPLKFVQKVCKISSECACRQPNSVVAAELFLASFASHRLPCW
eukprot:jgi/Ulvmu1/5211/UM022_0004.1